MPSQEFNPLVSFWVYPSEQLHRRIYWVTDPETGKQKPKAKAPRTYEKAKEEGKSYSTIEHRKLKDIVLDLIPNISSDIKGVEGSMFFFIDDTEVYHNKEDMMARGTYFSIGICGIDLDNMPEELASLVNSHFNSYTEKMPQLVASYISNSKEGVHIVVRCREGLDHKQYVLQTILQTLRLVEVIKEVDGVDLTEYIDVSSTSMSQRHFTARCDCPQWNDFAEDSYIEVPDKCPIDGDTKAIINIKKRWRTAVRNEQTADEMIREFMPELFDEKEEVYELDNISEPIDPDIYIEYNQRWLVWIALFKLLGNGKRFDQEVQKVADLLSRNSKKEGKSHDPSYFIEEANRSLKESNKAYSFPRKNLAKLGYSVKSSKIIQFEEKVKAAKAEEDDKRKAMVAARKKRISNITPTASKIKLEGRYITDKEIQIIEKTVNENERVTLKAPTGTGKTTAIKRIANEHNAVVLAPFNVLVQEYASDLKVIKDEKEYKGTACCMTYDRLVIMGAHNFRDKWIFVDEAHVLFMDRIYRPKLVELFKQLDRLTANGCRIIFVSATPIFTEGTKLLEFYQDRPLIRVYPVFLKCKDGKHGKRAENFVKKRILDGRGLDDVYDRILIFTNNSARRLYDSTVFVKRDKVGIMHSQYTGECQKITCDNKLKAKYTMCTSIAYNGVNFINEDEYIAVISMVEDYTTAWNIIQQCGRVRNSIVDLFILFDIDTESESLSVEQRVKLNELRGELGLNTKVLWDDQIEADKEVEQYIQENSDRFKILNELIDEEYFLVRGQIYLELDGEPKHNPVRRAVDDYIKRNLCAELLDSTIIPNFDKEIMTKYFRESINAINSLIDGQYNTNVTEIAELLKNTGTKSIKTVVAELKHIKTALSYSDSDLMLMEAQYKNMLEEYKNDKILLKQLRAQVNEIEKMHSEYINCKNDHEIITTYNAAQTAKRENQSNGRSKGGKNFGVEIKVTKNGKTKTFKSKKAAAEWIGCSRPTLDAAIKGQKSLNGFTIS